MDASTAALHCVGVSGYSAARADLSNVVRFQIELLLVGLQSRVVTCNIVQNLIIMENILRDVPTKKARMEKMNTIPTRTETIKYVCGLMSRIHARMITLVFFGSLMSRHWGDSTVSPRRIGTTPLRV